MIGLAGIGNYVPRETITLEEIAPDYDSSKRQKIGVSKVPRELQLTATQMAIVASEQAMKMARLDPLCIDLIINTQCTLPDYLMWQVSAEIQTQLQAKRAMFFDLYQGCSGFVAGLWTAKSLLHANEELSTILVATSEKWDSTVERRAVGGIVFGDGGAAAIVQRDCSRNILLGHSMICRGEFNDVSRMGIGAINAPLVCQNKELFSYSVTNLEKARNVMIPINIDAFYEVGTRAIRNSGCVREDIDCLIFPNVDCGLFEKVARRFGFESERTNYRYVRETGDCGTVEALLNYNRLLEDGTIRKGNRVLVLSQGAGATWAAMVMQV